MIETERLLAWLHDSHERTLELTADLDQEQWRGPELDIVNTPSWEVGHVAWFSELWALRRGFGRKSLIAGSDLLYDSGSVLHQERWHLGGLDRASSFRYLGDVHGEISSQLESGAADPSQVYLILYGLFHSDMHNEAFAYMRQTLGYPLSEALAARSGEVSTRFAGEPPGDLVFPAGEIMLGADPADGFVFDNEKWQHRVEHAAFAIGRQAVTRGEFCAFVEAGGYRRPEFWSAEGRRWRLSNAAEQPAYWRMRGSQCQERCFDRWGSLKENLPVVHVNWYEAEAYCRWAGRRLPTEVEWEVVAKKQADAFGLKAQPWWQQSPKREAINLDYRHPGLQPAGNHDSEGLAHLFGNVWEWTASTFRPYPGFERDCYRDYSFPWFETRKVLRGGSWATASRMLRATYRNFYEPHRRDVFAGFRTCAQNP